LPVRTETEIQAAVGPVRGGVEGSDRIATISSIQSISGLQLANLNNKNNNQILKEDKNCLFL
jgi:hypothetical protein